MTARHALAEPPQSAPDPVAAAIRTLTPYLAGWIMTGLLALLDATHWHITVPNDARDKIASLLPIALGWAYYLLAHLLLERRWPRIPWLGSRRQPTYTDPTARHAEIEGDVSTEPMNTTPIDEPAYEVPLAFRGWFPTDGHELPPLADLATIDDGEVAS